MRAATGRAPGADRWLGFVAVAGFAAVAAALVSQHWFDMQPCAWCVLQRLIFIAASLAALLGLAWRGSGGRITGGALVLFTACAGMAAALWQHFVAAKSESCNLTLADRIVAGLGLDASLPDVFQARASCADAAVKLFGLYYEWWSLALFALLAFAALRVLRSRR